MTSINPIWLLLLLLFTGKGGGRGGGGRAADPFKAFEPGPGPQPISYKGGGGGMRGRWKPYKPLTPEVIARAQALLNDRSVHEVIEKDAAGGVVRYLRTTDNPPGHVSVTAWRPVDSGIAV